MIFHVFPISLLHIWINCVDNNISLRHTQLNETYSHKVPRECETFSSIKFGSVRDPSENDCSLSETVASHINKDVIQLLYRVFRCIIAEDILYIYVYLSFPVISLSFKIVISPFKIIYTVKQTTWRRWKINQQIVAKIADSLSQFLLISNVICKL